MEKPKYSLTVLYWGGVEEENKQFHTRKEVKEYIEDLVKEKKFSEIGFFFYEGIEVASKKLIAYFKWNFCQFNETIIKEENFSWNN